MFQSPKIAKDLIWHAQGGEFDGKMRHPSDSPSWKVIDHRWPDFSVEPRNLRLAISADGINPHSSLSSRYSCWPVVMITYNLPPWLCMKRKFMMLSLLISGPQQPGNDIDIYLAPLIEDLKTLWEIGVEAYDAYQREVFTLRVVLLWTINDFPAYGNLSGCTVKGYFACPICGSETYSHRLKHGRKNSFTGHRHFLPCNHPFRKHKKAFNGEQEFRSPPQPLSGEEILLKMNAIWKTKDGLNSRLDLMDMGLRCELAPRNLVSMEDLKLYGLKSHDYHTLMQQLLPMALRSLLPKHVRHAIARLSFFFNALCKKVVDVSTLDKLQNELVVTLCLLEKVPSSTNVDHKVGAPIPGEDSDDFMDNSIEHHPLITTLPQVESFDTMDDSDVICIRGDCEGFWIDNKSSMHGFKGRENPYKKKYKGTTRKSMIIRNRNRGIKLVIKYNADGIYVGESSVHLTSYLGVLARTMVPIRYNTWRDVPEQLKDKLWDSIENTLTVKHILPFKDEPELLKKPPTEYHFIDDEDWNIFVKNRLSEKFQMIEAGSTESIDRSLLWKRAMQKKDGSYDDVVLPVVEKIDELMKESQESGISYSGSNDILSQALGTPEYTGRVRAKGKHYTPGQYFNSMSERVVRDILKATQERQVKFEADVLARLSQIGVATPQSDARKCELAVGTRENTVAGGTIVMDCGPNYLVVLDAPYESNTPLPIPIPGQATTVGAAVGYQVLWPTHLVNLSTKFIKGSQKGKRQKTTENDLKIGENPQDINNFDALVGLMLNEGKAQGVEHLQKKLSDARLTERFAFINPALVSKAGMGETTKENRSRLIANRLMHAKRADYIFIPYNPDFHWVLVALDMRTMTAYYLDPMQKQPCDDLKEIVNMALRIHPPEKQRSSKREPTWVKVVCPRQLGSVECGYYVMRYMKDIIVDPSLLSTKMPSFQSSKSCRSHFDDSHKFSSHDK
ncbi:hypothetical protein CK203_021010 [Vitis vinifera]|uniref:Ubiquitin-like protease family profile domain-containing protein n=1 Tax=Vitis vinifera TaxID=29760 RepID=A0A438JWN9_VITVI|nr:hypothetical protein CK203_021010 [Vitis vinifera]